ncbi:hypothetical protein IV203_010833 [Nitzschia inconspicua]|uniref:Uncharacterized protein n=1 Tax=Nitzschia inconspicua TaxID=303405 RepID=A0A9K3KX63_9STRA|nr:hypothetical protein IV203_021603 [Nitzschia inconspicua]KAG7342763.1 hypothetical protein IV203_020707 [Nitzschia inconspicua]KAG7351473.1 hypothetical protein IV203_010833 [Nitzschia inconspicua]
MSPLASIRLIFSRILKRSLESNDVPGGYRGLTKRLSISGHGVVLIDMNVVVHDGIVMIGADAVDEDVFVVVSDGLVVELMRPDVTEMVTMEGKETLRAHNVSLVSLRPTQFSSNNLASPANAA